MKNWFRGIRFIFEVAYYKTSKNEIKSRFSNLIRRCIWFFQ